MNARRWAVLAAAIACLPAARAGAQGRVTSDDDWCDQRGNSDRATACEVREFRLQARSGILRVDGGANGGISVAGWDRNEILVRARVEARARTDDDAEALLHEVRVETEGTIRADGPHTGRREHWGVSFEVFVPRRSDLDLATVNGGISIDDVNGSIAFDATNGGVTLSHLGGDVRGRTTNGGLTVELTGTEWDGRGLDARTMNGGVHVSIPEGYNADLETGTVNGGMRIDFPVMVQGRIGRQLRVTLGRGGAPIRAVTTNGGVEIGRN